MGRRARAAETDGSGLPQRHGNHRTPPTRGWDHLSEDCPARFTSGKRWIAKQVTSPRSDDLTCDIKAG